MGWTVYAESLVPLLLHPPPSVTRARAIETLDRVDRRVRRPEGGNPVADGLIAAVLQWAA